MDSALVLTFPWRAVVALTFRRTGTSAPGGSPPVPIAEEPKIVFPQGEAPSVYLSQREAKSCKGDLRFERGLTKKGSGNERKGITGERAIIRTPRP